MLKQLDDHHPVEFQLPDWLKKRKSTPYTFIKRSIFLSLLFELIFFLYHYCCFLSDNVNSLVFNFLFFRFVPHQEDETPSWGWWYILLLQPLFCPVCSLRQGLPLWVSVFLANYVWNGGQLLFLWLKMLFFLVLIVDPCCISISQNAFVQLLPEL